MVSATLFILVMCWIAVGVSFLLPFFRNNRQFGSIDALRRLRGPKGPLADLPGHDHIGEPHIATEPHAELAPRYTEQPRRPTNYGSQVITLPEQELVVASTGSATYFDPWTKQYVNENGEVANAPTTMHSELNSRATAYARPLVDGHRPATQPISAKRRAALRRRQVLKSMAIAISSTTVPAVLTGWTFFVTLSVLSWLAFGAWFSLMLFFMFMIGFRDGKLEIFLPLLASIASVWMPSPGIPKLDRQTKNVPPPTPPNTPTEVTGAVRSI